MQAVGSRDTATKDYELNRRPVMGMLAKRFPRFDENERLEIYHEAWARVFTKRERGEEIRSLRAYLLQTAAAEAMNAVTRGRPPVPIGPDDPAVTGLEDEGSAVEDRVLMRDQVRLAREMIDSLEGRQRDLLKLRWDLQLSAGEVRAALGLTHRQYQRLAEEGAAVIASRVRDLEDGTWSRRQRSLLTACLIDVGDVDSLRPGIASDEQRAEAQRLLASDPHVAALYLEVRGAMRRAAAILPLPAIPLGNGFLPAVIGDRIAAFTDQVGSLLDAVRQQATGAYLRAADLTPFAGASPSAFAATVAGCVALGGGTYVAAEGLPNTLSPSEGRSPIASGQAVNPAPKTPDKRAKPRREARKAVRPKQAKPSSPQQSPVDSPTPPTQPSSPDPGGLRSDLPTPQSSPARESNEFDFEN